MSKLLDTLLTRREAFRIGAAAVSAYWFLPLLEPTNVYAQAKVTPRGSARFVIFVMLEGGQSHVDSWDLKEGKWTPENFDIKEIESGFKWPMSLFPQLVKQRERFSLIRSMEAWDSVHFRAQYYVQSAHMMNPALQKELPPMGSVVAYEYAARRKANDTLARLCRRQRHAIAVGAAGVGIPAGHLHAVSCRYDQWHRRPSNGRGQPKEPDAPLGAPEEFR